MAVLKTVEDEQKDEGQNKKPSNSVPVSQEYTMSYEKYLDLYDPKIHLYLRAYLKPQFRGLTKSQSEWEKVLQEYEK